MEFFKHKQIYKVMIHNIKQIQYSYLINKDLTLSSNYHKSAVFN